MRILLAIPVLWAAGCTSAAADHERLGDRAYREGRFTAAVAEYRAGNRGAARPRLLAKLGAAALHDENLGQAVEAYVALGEADPSRSAEAVAGLVRVARQAEKSGAARATNLAAAVRALRALAPGRPLGRFALAIGPGFDATEALGVLPAALATATDAGTVDSLLLALGNAQRVTTACEAATRTYRVVLRRTRNPALRAAANQGTGVCALRLGLDALAASHADEAERWFETALNAGRETPSGWRAAIGLGDARLSQGDVLAAAIAYQGVVSGSAVPDSLVKLASDKLNALSSPTPPPAPGDDRR